MKLEQSFEVAAPLERVWEALIDVARVAPCLPGASVTGRNEDGSYNGKFKVKIGPTTAAYTGKLAMHDVDESAHTATMEAKGTDRRGQGGATATIVSTVSDSGDGSTRVEVITDYHITGRLARFGRGGMIEDISNRLLGDFAKCLQTSLAGAPAGAGETPQAAEAPDVGDGAAPSPGETPATDDGAAATAEGTEAAEPATTGGAGTPPPPPERESQPVAESEPVQGMALMGSVLWGQVKRNPAPFVAVVLGFLLALGLLRRRRS
jgi:carbon monoxide dehydrogenase subunit G